MEPPGDPDQRGPAARVRLYVRGTRGGPAGGFAAGAGVGVAIIDPDEPAPILNRAATELLERLSEGDDVLYLAAARPDDAAAAFSRAISVTLADGGDAVLRAQRLGILG